MMVIKAVALFSTNEGDEKCMPDFGRKQQDHLEDLAIEGTTLKLRYTNIVKGCRVDSVAQNRDERLAVLNVVMTFRLKKKKKAGNS
jgi:hypothetical protein